MASSRRAPASKTHRGNPPAPTALPDAVEGSAIFKPKILLIDLEAFPLVGYAWDLREVNIIKVLRSRMICSVAWKWYGQKIVHVRALPDFPEEYVQNWESAVPGKLVQFTNRSLMEYIRDLVNRAQIVVGHNVDKYDLRRANTDIIRYQLDVPAPYKTIDTLKIARQKFGFMSNRLQDLCEFLGIPGKVRHGGFELWERCMAGEMGAWDEIRRYNRGDIDPCLEQVFERFRPWHRPRWLTRMERGLSAT